MSEEVASDEGAKQLMRRKSRRSFLVGGISALAGLAGWHWLATQRTDGDIPWPLRRALEIDEKLARHYFRESRLAPTYSRASAREPRVNGTEGIQDDDFDPASWQLRVEGLAVPGRGLRPGDPAAAGKARQQGAGAGALLLTLEDIKALPRVEVVTELKCIEGWSRVVQWAGTRFLDFAAKYSPATRNGSPPDVHGRPQDLVGYVSLATPDGGYYVGLDMASALHAQTLLCYEMNGSPLDTSHGAPLRLVLPVKYGIKSIKRIGTIRFSDTRPADYWAERGYDWYAGL